jgi:hypothetical protein
MSTSIVYLYWQGIWSQTPTHCCIYKSKSHITFKQHLHTTYWTLKLSSLVFHIFVWAYLLWNLLNLFQHWNFPKEVQMAAMAIWTRFPFKAIIVKTIFLTKCDLKKNFNWFYFVCIVLFNEKIIMWINCILRFFYWLFCSLWASWLTIKHLFVCLFVSFNSIMTGVTSGAGTANPSGAPEFTSGF